MLSQASLSEQLHALGLDVGQAVMVHASLRRLGPVEGRASGVIQSILSTLGESGTLLMVLGSREGDVFSAKDSVSDPEMGVLAEVFRKFPGAQVNDHAAARFCALGPQAGTLLENTPLNDYYDRGSVLERLTQVDGKILRLGADPDTTTLTHYAEYLAKVHPKRRVKRRYIRADVGEQWIESLDDCGGIQDWKHGDYFSQILIDFLNGDRAKTGTVGRCRAELIDAKAFVAFATQWMEDHLQKE